MGQKGIQFLQITTYFDDLGRLFLYISRISKSVYRTLLGYPNQSIEHC